jgi:ankyrin repeat protein
MYRAQLNQEDDLGLTPLHWAASQGDVLVVVQLLEAGADVNKQDRRGSTALYMACTAGSTTCSEALIGAGANLSLCETVHGYHPIHAAAERGRPELLSLLLSNGASVDGSQNQYKTTPLSRAVVFDKVENCKYLIEHGANINHFDWEGDNALSEAVVSCSYNVLKFFLSEQADYLHIDRYGMSILHDAAMKADAETMRILTAGKLRGLDPNLRDCQKKTARQYLEGRSGIDDSLRNAFNELILSIETANNTADENPDSSGDEDDEFFDSLETF